MKRRCIFIAYVNTRDTIGDQATFDGLLDGSLTELIEDGITSIASYAMIYHSNIINLSFPRLSRIENYAFQSCYNLKTVSIPKFASGGYQAFGECKNLLSINLSMASSVGSYMFQYCYKLSSVNIESARAIGRSAFTKCHALSQLSVPQVSSVETSAFQDTRISRLVFPSAVKLSSCIAPGNGPYEIDLLSEATIMSSAFASNMDLFNLFLHSTSVVPIPDTNVLSGTPIASGCGNIYVPGSLVESYRVADHWSAFESQILAIDTYTGADPEGIETITDSWDEILSAEDDGTYIIKYKVGDTKWLRVRGGWELMQIVAFHTDELANTSGYAKITWLSKGFYIKHQINTTSSTIGGWEACGLRAYLNDELFASIDQTVRAAIKTVKKTYAINTPSVETLTCNDNVWIPSYREMFGANNNSGESSGCTYISFFTDSNSRTKYQGWKTESKDNWVLRSASSSTNYFIVGMTGGISNTTATTMSSVVFGFCT